MSAELVPSEDCEGESVPCLSHSFWLFACHLWLPWLLLNDPNLCLSLHMIFSLCVCCCVQNCPFYKKKVISDQDPTLPQSDFNLIISATMKFMFWSTEGQDSNIWILGDYKSTHNLCQTWTYLYIFESPNRKLSSHSLWHSVHIGKLFPQIQWFHQAITAFRIYL